MKDELLDSEFDQDPLDDLLIKYEGIERDVLEAVALKREVGAKLQDIVDCCEDNWQVSCEEYDDTPCIEETLLILVEDKILFQVNDIYFLGEL